MVSGEGDTVRVGKLLHRQELETIADRADRARPRLRSSVSDFEVFSLARRLRAEERCMLHGRRVLIVEDESLIAMELSDIVEGHAGRVIGPFRTNRDALAALAGDPPIDAAILDLNLADGEATPTAERLRDAGVPILICTAGTLPRGMRPMTPDLVIHRKPIRPSRLVADLSALWGTA